jgi:hypothetical protein
MRNPTYDAICWEGAWSFLPRSCGGNVEVWDQTVGCPECGMNIWNLPAFGQWPEWDATNAPAEDHWEKWKRNRDVYNPYDVYVNLFFKLHPFQFDDCHDPGDEDRSESDTQTLGP